MAKNERFEKIYSQGNGFTDLIQILLDRETGVQYLYRQTADGAGLTVLLDSQGKPVIGRPGRLW